MNGRPPAPLRALAEACVRQQLTVPVADDHATFAARKGLLRLAVRSARGALLLRASGQWPVLRTRFDPAWKRVLWIHEGMPQIGDALMDLAPRSLLTERGLRVDLFAAPHIATLFEGDAWFTRSLQRPEDVDPGAYDAAIVISHDHKALKLKRARLAQLPWVSLQGFYNGPDFHRARFATQRLADLLGITLDRDAFERHAAQRLRATTATLAWAALACPDTDRVALVLGGVWPNRTYHRWPELAESLRSAGARRFVLVGADNGRALADQLRAQAPADTDLLDLVGRTTLPEARAVLGRCAAIVCTDGGLMHLALTTERPVVALFTAEIDPAWRLPARANADRAFRSATPEVDGVSPGLVATAVVEAIRAAR